jgi:hypothetical protein
LESPELWERQEMMESLVLPDLLVIWVRVDFQDREVFLVLMVRQVFLEAKGRLESKVFTLIIILAQKVNNY